MLELTAYQRSRLAADEQVFWCGKTRPVARFAAWPLFVVFGVVACAMAMFSPFLRSVWWLVRKDGTPAAVKIGFALFALPFVGVALGFLLSPLWHWIYTRGSVWVITDRRVIRFFGPFAKSWGYDKLFEYVEWSSAGHGCLDFAFSEHWDGEYMTTAEYPVRVRRACVVDIRRWIGGRATGESSSLPSIMERLYLHENDNCHFREDLLLRDGALL